MLEQTNEQRTPIRIALESKLRMGVGADDYIDKMLVQKYQEEKVDNHDNMESMVDPNKMMEAMNDYAATLRNMMELRQRLNIACYAINARTARYQRSMGQR